MNMTETVKLYDIDPDGARHMAQKLHRKKEDIEVVRKYFTSEKSEADAKERSVVSYISTGIKDRDGEVLEPGGVVLDNYRKNPIVMYAHDYHGVPVGKNIWIKQDEKGLIAKTMFANTEFADQIYQLYSEDIGGTGPVLKAFSVGFIPLEWEDGPGANEWNLTQEMRDPNTPPRRTYTKWELLEYSCVPVPSCPEALALAYEKGVITSDRLKKDLGFDDAPVRIEEGKGDMAVRIEPPNGGAGGNGPVIETPAEVKAEIATKPETTENYHHIPVSEGHDGHEIKTIDIDTKKGIKALYCVTCKEIKTYLFPTDSFTMEQAQAWVDEHEEGKAGKLEMTVTLLSDELQGELAFLRETIESIKAMLPMPSENDSESLKAFIGEVKEEIRAVGENVAELMATVEGMKATPPAEAPEVDIALALPSAREPEDIGAIVREAMAELDMAALLKQVVKVELAKLRGRVE